MEAPEANASAGTSRVNPWRIVVIALWVFSLILGACLLGASGQYVGYRFDPQIGVAFSAINFFVAGLLFTVVGFVVLIRWLFVEFAAWRPKPSAHHAERNAALDSADSSGE